MTRVKKKHSWSVISRNERSITIAGRHFFATRCSRKGSEWTLMELDGDGKIRIRYLPTFETKELMSAVINAAK